MALITHGIGIADLSGSIGGTTFARNRYGAYARARVKPKNPKSVRQLLIRAGMGSMKSLWSALTQPQRQAWDTYGDNVTMINRLGNAVKLSGWNHFVRVNQARVGAGIATNVTAPTLYSLAETDPSIVASADASEQLLSTAFNNALPWAIEAGGYLIVSMSKPQDPGITYYGGPWRYIGKIAGGVVPPISPAGLAVYTTVTTGQRVWARYRILRADNRLSEPFHYTGLCVA
jgi:hypothetical protein